MIMIRLFLFLLACVLAGTFSFNLSAETNGVSGAPAPTDPPSGASSTTDPGQCSQTKKSCQEYFQRHQIQYRERDLLHCENQGLADKPMDHLKACVQPIKDQWKALKNLLKLAKSNPKLKEMLGPKFQTVQETCGPSPEDDYDAFKQKLASTPSSEDRVRIYQERITSGTKYKKCVIGVIKEMNSEKPVDLVKIIMDEIKKQYQGAAKCFDWTYYTEVACHVALVAAEGYAAGGSVRLLAEMTGVKLEAGALKAIAETDGAAASPSTLNNVAAMGDTKAQVQALKAMSDTEKQALMKYSSGLTDAQRVSQAENLLQPSLTGGKLTPTQTEGLKLAHEAGGFNENLAGKFKILTDHGFTPDQAQVLMRSALAGQDGFVGSTVDLGRVLPPSTPTQTITEVNKAYDALQFDAFNPASTGAARRMLEEEGTRLLKTQPATGREILVNVSTESSRGKYLTSFQRFDKWDNPTGYSRGAIESEIPRVKEQIAKLKATKIPDGLAGERASSYQRYLDTQLRNYQWALQQLNEVLDIAD